MEGILSKATYNQYICQESETTLYCGWSRKFGTEHKFQALSRSVDPLLVNSTIASRRCYTMPIVTLPIATLFSAPYERTRTCRTMKAKVAGGRPLRTLGTLRAEPSGTFRLGAQNPPRAPPINDCP